MTDQLEPGDLARQWLAATQTAILIDGRWQPVTSDQRFESIDPATGDRLATLGQASQADVDSAVAAARRAFENPSWAAMLPAVRARLLWKIADALEADIDLLSELETLDQGKTLRTSRFAEIPSAIEQFRYFAGYATKITGISYRPSIGYAPAGRQVVAQTTPQPIGVVAAIVPWNSPLLMAAMKIAPALAAGCTVVLKPAEDTSLTALRLGELLMQAGLPDGVVNVITGDGTVGAALAGHADIDKVAFTGSTEVGRRLVTAAAGTFTRLTLELGGKSPALVLPDADLELAVPGLGRGIFANSGQVCVAGSRIYAHRSVFDEVVSGLAEQAAKTVVGSGLDPSSDLGPLVSTAHADRVESYLTDTAGGLHIEAGGRRGATAFFEPTVVTGASADHRLMREEIFGPVAAVVPFDDLDEAIRLANDSKYGLAASVWTQDLSLANRVSQRVQAGTVWVNCHSYFSPELVKGGHKESGWGYENGPNGLAAYMEYKTVCTLV